MLSPRGNAIRFVTRGVLVFFAGLLIGCGSSSRTAPDPADGAQPPALRALRSGARALPSRVGRRAPMTREQRIALHRAAQRVLPPHAYAALEKLGMPATPPGSAGARRASVALPYNMPADQPYTPGDAGYIGSSSDVTFPGPPFGGADMAPGGTAFPDNFSYIIYRVDDVTQTPEALNVYFGLVPPGVELGVAFYNWA